MFSSKDSNASLPAALRSSGHEPGLSILAAGIRVVGEIETDGVVKIEGEVEGSVRADGQVLVAKGGVVKGDISTRQAVVAGEVHGAIFGDERVELQPGSVIDGDITAPRIVVAEGGQVNGHIRMATPPANAARQQGEKDGAGKGKRPSGPGREQPFELAGSSGPSDKKLTLDTTPPPSATAGGTGSWAKRD
jgi:cytoskeletal protein CcmA (bactofilin family)